MAFKYTRHTLKKVETILEESGYVIRYEKGNFNSGYCIVEDRKIAVINKFFDVEGRINVLLDIIAEIEVQPEILSTKAAKFYKTLQSHLDTENEEEEPTEETTE